MDQTKTSVITGVLAKQADRNREIAQIARREMSEHTGAAQVLALLSKQMPGFADAMEKRIEGDGELGRAADAVRVYVKNAIAQFNAMCESQAAHQRKQAMLCEGRAQGAEQMVVQLDKEIAFETTAAARRDELEAERRAKQEASKADEEKTEEKVPDPGTPRKTRKRKAG